MVIQHNMSAWNANRQFKVNTGKSKKITEKLSSGYKINRAADDAAGLAISEKMRRQIRGLSQSAENIQDGIGYVQTADGALNEAQDILQRMNELAVKSANGTNTEVDREYIDSEVQQLKVELDRIFSTTTFNEKKIWDPKFRKQIGSEIRQAVTYRATNSRPDITNANTGVIPINGYRAFKVHADQTGVYMSWTGHDKADYQTETIDWATLKANNYSFEMSDYFGDKATSGLYDANGNPLFKHRIAFTPVESATIDDMITCLDGNNLPCYPYAYMNTRFENNTGAAVSNSYVYIYDEDITYAAAYASNVNSLVPTDTEDVFDFDNANDLFLEPRDGSGNKITSTSTTGNVTAIPDVAKTIVANGGTVTNQNVTDARNSSQNWQMSFYMDGIGKVTASSVGGKYWSSNNTEGMEKCWWQWVQKYQNGTWVNDHKATQEHQLANGSLGAVMDALTGAQCAAGTGTPGLLTTANGGDCSKGGTIQLNFNLTSENAFFTGTDESGNELTSNRVGSFQLRINVNSTDTEADVLKRISQALTNTTILDFYSTARSGDAQVDTPWVNTHKIEVPIWGGTCGFFVQGGTEAGQHIGVTYEALSVRGMGLYETNVLTEESSGNAINEIKSALREISDQRATFGAYQNRLEHSYNVNKNTEENTQASESVIRDTDMAKMMVAQSNQNILLQVGQAMMAQANSSNQGILQLLQ